MPHLSKVHSGRCPTQSACSPCSSPVQASKNKGKGSCTYSYGCSILNSTVHLCSFQQNVRKIRTFLSGSGVLQRLSTSDAAAATFILTALSSAHAMKQSATVRHGSMNDYADGWILQIFRLTHCYCYCCIWSAQSVAFEFVYSIYIYK